MGSFEQLFPEELRERVMPVGDELVFTLDDAKRAIHLAGENSIAVLGVDIWHIHNGTPQRAVGYSDYDFKSWEAWRDCVRLNNEAARQFLEKVSLGEVDGYLLTTASEREHPATSL
jgi:hypothetical protein